MATITTWFTLGLLGELLGTALLAYGYRLVPEATRKRYLLLVAIPGIAIFAYLLLVLGIGAIDGGGHTVYVVRYVDWLLTTPINVLYLGLLANANREAIGKLVGLQALTIVFGFAGAVASGALAYALFALGAAAFAGVVYLLYYDVADAAVASLSDVEASLYRTLRNFVVVLWSVYPVVWLLGAAGVGLMDVETASLVIVYLDVVTKVGFGIIALNAWLTIDSVTTADGSSVAAD
ncbi:bacteriorhodopsin [Haloarcula salinisoli]|uniref:Bacteriorhodopsin n=1 Tax=Haloarcula salinisoli TaxID=2487746 RepID=A0A8J7YHF4_9EURY|nr:bacteriorhodopsin [Halomicroarcula salinisoli]MBX0285747.1 bacteriorhodopsin [Halomicroarcula salinisoli]MBX0302764.1 bacteriorhodopsin [Halomicroarcula salinisoli]